MPIEVRIRPLPLVRATADGPERVTSVSWQASEPGGATLILSSGRDQVQLDVHAVAGPNSVTVCVPEPHNRTTLRAAVRDNSGEGCSPEIPFGPVRPWRVFVVHHSHLDIGYTDVQDHVLQLHLDFIDEALTFCEQTMQWPEDSRFRWNFEATHPLVEYCRRRKPSDIERLRRCLQHGQMEITAFSVNLHAETCSYEELVEALRDGQELAKRFGVSMQSAMQSDVPGLPWTAVQLLASNGVRYLSLAPNNYRAPVHEHRKFGRPFWWQTPEGDRVLTWFTDDPRHVYQEGNFLGFNDSYEAVLRTLPVRLQDLEDAGFPYDALHLRCQGAYADNGPPNLRISEVVRRWNEEWLWPKVRMACNRDFFVYVEKRWSTEIPSYSGDWPDWWADGTGSAAREMALIRAAHGLAEMAGNAAALAPSAPPIKGLADDLAGAYREMLLFDEHTWGAARPEENALRGIGSEGLQWSFKSAFAHRAHLLGGSAADAALRRLAAQLTTGESPAVFVFNSVCTPRRSPVTVDLPRWLGATERDGLRLIDPETGQDVAYEWIPPGTHDRAALHFVPPEVPPLGYRRLDLRVGEGQPAADCRRADGPAETTLANSWISLALDPARGGIGSLKDRVQDRELVDQTSPHALNTFITDRYVKEGERDRLAVRQVAAPVEIAASTSSPIDRTITYRWAVGMDTDAIRCTLRLYRELPDVRLENLVLKRAVPQKEKECLYFAFPFVGEGLHRIHYDLPGGACILGSDQLPGSLPDWLVVTSGVWLEGVGFSFLWGSADTGLVQFGAMRSGHPEQQSGGQGQLYSYVANNLWDTNFRPSQEGELLFRYRIEGTGAMDNKDFAAFGKGMLEPLSAVVMSAGNTGPLQETSGELLHVSGAGVFVQSVRVAERGGLILRLRECCGEDAVAEVSVGSGRTEAVLVTPLGQHLHPLIVERGVARIPLRPHQVVHVQV